MHLMYFTEQPMSAYPEQAGRDFGATALMFPLAGGVGLMSNRASEVVANGSAQLVAVDAQPAVAGAEQLPQ